MFYFPSWAIELVFELFGCVNSLLVGWFQIKRCRIYCKGTIRCQIIIKHAIFGSISLI
jgi:hypothetical protein